MARNNKYAPHHMFILFYPNEERATQTKKLTHTIQRGWTLLSSEPPCEGASWGVFLDNHAIHEREFVQPKIGGLDIL
jgi:hypothetical protein